MYPLSYFVFPLIPLLFYNKSYASYFYPFVLITTVIGVTFLLLLIFSKSFDEFYYTLYPNAITANIENYNLKLYIYISLIILKIFIDIIWPKNLSLQAFFVSLCYYVFYLFIYFIYLFIRLYNNCK